jgi:hypothetical protein
MKATVVEIQSGEQYTDKQRRVKLYFKDAGMCYQHLVLPIAALGVEGVALDDVLDVMISRVAAVTPYANVTQAKAKVAEGKW